MKKAQRKEGSFLVNGALYRKARQIQQRISRLAAQYGNIVTEIEKTAQYVPKK